MIEIVTISQDFWNNDRSYTKGFFQVVAQNNTHTKLKIIESDPLSFEKGKYLLVLNGTRRMANAKSLIGKDKYLSLMRRTEVKL